MFVSLAYSKKRKLVEFCYLKLFIIHFDNCGIFENGKKLKNEFHKNLKGGGNMKSILALILSVILLTFAADSIAFNADKLFHFAGDNEELYGTWINMDYTGRPAQKLVFNPDGTAGSSASVDLDTHWKIRYLIVGKWTDSEGNIMYKSHWVGNWREEGFSLHKISNSGGTLEYVFDHDDYPKEIDPKHSNYRKYTRK